MKELLDKAILDGGDTIVLQMVYQNEDGTKKRRFVSPYYFTGPDVFYAMCLTTGELRQFLLARCADGVEFPAHEVEIPMPVEIV